MKILTMFVSSKHNRRFQKVLTVGNPAEQPSADTAAGSSLELSGDRAPEELPCLCREARS